MVHGLHGGLPVLTCFYNTLLENVLLFLAICCSINVSTNVDGHLGSMKAKVSWSKCSVIVEFSFEQGRRLEELLVKRGTAHQPSTGV